MLESMRKILKRLHVPNWLLTVFVVIFVLRIPSFFEPFYYGDEMIYLTIGNAFRNGLVLYRDILDYPMKTPLLYIVAGISGNVFWFRAILALWMMVTTYLFWLLVGVLFKREPLVQKVSVWSFAILTSLPLLEGQTANAELFMIGPTIAAFYLLLSRKLTARVLVTSGMLFSISTLFKVPAVFDVLAIVFLWIIAIKFKRNSLNDFLGKSAYLFLGYFSLIGITFLWYWLAGAFNEYLTVAYLQNVGYLSSFRPEHVSDPFLVRNTPIFYRGLLIGSGLSLLYFFRNKLSKEFIFVSAWLLLGLFAITLSERPYPHYLIQSVPPVAALLGILFARASIEQSLSVIPLFSILLVPVYFNFWYYQSLPYYTNFVEFAVNRKSRLEYFDGFDVNANRNYQIAEKIMRRSSPADRIFVWEDSPAIYALSRRLPSIQYVANYHIDDFSSAEFILSQLVDDPPVYVVILPEAKEFKGMPAFLDDNYILHETINGAELWKALKVI